MQLRSQTQPTDFSVLTNWLPYKQCAEGIPFVDKLNFQPLSGIYLRKICCKVSVFKQRIFFQNQSLRICLFEFRQLWNPEDDRFYKTGPCTSLRIFKLRKRCSTSILRLGKPSFPQDGLFILKGMPLTHKGRATNISSQKSWCNLIARTEKQNSGSRTSLVDFDLLWKKNMFFV